MQEPGSVTVLLNGLREGDPEAARRLWGRYSPPAEALARARLRGTPRGAGDEEDVALGAFDELCRLIRQGALPALAGRGHFWRLLATITSRRARRLVERECRLKRDWRRPGPAPGVELPAGRGADPAFAAEMADRCVALLARLPDDGHRLIAVRRLEGYTSEEIAQQIGCSLKTVERRLSVIRECWSDEARRG